MPFTDAQLVLLSAASQRDDRLLPRPDKLAGAALDRMQGSLTKAGAAEPVPVRADQPCWRRDAAENPIGLRITAAGLAAIGVEPPLPFEDGALETHRPEPETLRRPASAPAPARSVRPGTKQARLVALLTEADGAGIDALVTALAWQPHTVRAALTRLRQGGFAVTAGKDGQNKTVYRIEPATDARAAPSTPVGDSAGEIA